MCEGKIIELTKRSLQQHLAAQLRRDILQTTFGFSSFPWVLLHRIEAS